MTSSPAMLNRDASVGSGTQSGTTKRGGDWSGPSSKCFRVRRPRRVRKPSWLASRRRDGSSVTRTVSDDISLAIRARMRNSSGVRKTDERRGMTRKISSALLDSSLERIVPRSSSASRKTSSWDLGATGARRKNIRLQSLLAVLEGLFDEGVDVLKGGTYFCRVRALAARKFGVVAAAAAVHLSGDLLYQVTGMHTIGQVPRDAHHTGIRPSCAPASTTTPECNSWRTESTRRARSSPEAPLTG